jgi:hypothetical protein
MKPLELPPGKHGNERIVEYSWALTQLEPQTSILDVGTVAPPIMSGYPEFVFSITRRLGCRYTTLDSMPGAHILADMRDVSLPDKSYDVVTCISTLEHISIIPWAALRNMCRIGKKVLVTMPFGLMQAMPWGFQYDKGLLSFLLSRAGVEAHTAVYFAYGPEGWAECSAEFLEHRPYASCGASDAAGVVCLEIIPPVLAAPPEEEKTLDP